MKNVTIDQKRCTRCGRCVAVCPRGTMLIDQKTGIPFAAPDGPCTVCGHCAAYCPTGALHLQDDLPPAPALDPTLAPLTQPQLTQYLRSRRSVRAYKKEPVERRIIEGILDTARYAPTGMNRQALRWIIIHTPGELHRLADIAIGWVREQARLSPEFAERYSAVVTAWDAGHDAICRGAPHLAIALSDRSFGLAHTDVVIALSYFEIAAPSFGIGTCWAGYMDLVINSCPALQKELGIKPEEETLGALLLGYPAYQPVRLPARKSPAVGWL